ncbi:MAG: efflux RND transporter permease subunit, partial [Alphaproteobacteria bacterium]|nr:efflux RND transporter permease subunit [Alphaproteobacteria bacterium]
MFSAFFIDRPKFAFVISIVIALIGLIAIQLIPVAEYPEIAPPQVKVTTTYPGANATVVQETVASPIEAEVNGVDDMIYMSSTSSNDGRYELTVTFEVGTDPDIAAVNVQNRVAIANAKLPPEVTRQGITTKKQSSSILMVINLVSPKGSHNELFLSNYASINVQDVLSRIDGVGSVSQFGALDYGMRVWLDPKRLTSLELTTTDIANAIEAQNIQATAGQLGAPPFGKTPQFQYAIQAKGRLVSVEEFENIVVRAEPDGSFIRLRDVARIELGSQSYGTVSKLNNRPAASIAIYLSPGANALAVADRIYDAMDRLSQRFPPGVEDFILYDTTNAVRASVREVIDTLFITFVLVVAVTFLFLGDWRPTIIPTLAIPVSVIGTFAVLFIVGFSANMITLFAAILAIGVVVDDSIVVVENVQRIMAETGQDARAATRQAMREVTGPVIATTLVLLAVFVPVSFMPGITGELYRQFSVTICVAVSISSLNALTLSPALCALLLRPGTGQARGPLRVFARLVDKTRDGYVGLVERMIRRSALSLVIFAAFVGGTIYLFQIVPTGFVPQDDQGVFFVNIQLPDGASLSRTEAVADRASEIIKAVDGVTDVISISGFSILGGTASNAALLIPILADWDERTTPELQWRAILGNVNRKLATLIEADAFAFPIPPIAGLGTGGSIEAELEDLEGRSPEELAAALRGLVFKANQDPALSNIFSTYSANVPQLFIDVDRDKAEVRGISVAEVFAILQASRGSSY